MKRVCLLSPASRASDAIVKVGTAGGLGTAVTEAGPCTVGGEANPWAALGAIRGVRDNAAAHNSPHPSQTRRFARLANDSMPPEEPSLTALGRYG